MEEKTSWKFVNDLNAKYKSADIEANIFYYLLEQHLLPNYKPKEKTQDCLFIGPGESEINAVKSFLKKEYGVDKIFTAGLKPHKDPYCEKVLDSFVWGRVYGDARYSTAIEVEILPRIQRETFNSIFIRRPRTVDEDDLNNLKEILDNCFNYLSKDGMLIATSAFTRDKEPDNLKRVVENSRFKQIISKSTGLKDIGWETEDYIFIGGK